MKGLQDFIKNAGKNVKLSMCLMGLGQIFYGQIGKGLCYLGILVLAIAYFLYRGFADLAGLFTLGTKEADTWLGVQGDNSVVMLLMGILAIIALLFLAYCYISNIMDAYETQKICKKGGQPARFQDDLKQFLDKKFYKTVLFLPIIGVCLCYTTYCLYDCQIVFGWLFSCQRYRFIN